MGLEKMVILSLEKISDRFRFLTNVNNEDIFIYFEFIEYFDDVK